MLAMVSGQVFRLVRKRNGLIVVIAGFYCQTQFLLSFSHAYLYYVYGAHVPFLCTSTYRTGDNIYTHKMRIINEHKMKVINK